MNQNKPPFSASSQSGIIYKTLKKRIGKWVSMVDLGNKAGCWAVHSRIADIRKYVKPSGMEVLNEVRVSDDGKSHSFYMLKGVEL